MIHHPKLGVLADHVMQIQSLDSASVQHVERCAECLANLRWLNELATLRKSLPPRSATEAVLKIFKSKPNAA